MANNVTLAVAVDRETENQLEAISKATGESISKIIRTAIIAYVAKGD